MFSNTNGTLSSILTPAKLAGSTSPQDRDISPSQEFLNLASPVKADQRRTTISQPSATSAKADRRVSFAAPPSPASPSTLAPLESAPATPAGTFSASDYHNAFETPKPRDLQQSGADGFELSPTTPYFLHGPSALVQQTCPPKQQTQQLLFPLSGRIEDQSDESVRQRLVMARRKSLQFAPKVGSPLAKGFEGLL